MQKINGKDVLVKIPYELLERIDKVAKRHDHSRSETIRILCDIGLDVYDTFSATGVFKLHEIYEKAKSAIKDMAGQKRLFTK